MLIKTIKTYDETYQDFLIERQQEDEERAKQAVIGYAKTC